MHFNTCSYNWQRPVAHSPIASESYTPPGGTWQLGLNHPRCGAEPIPGLRNSLCQPGQQGRGLSLGMGAHRAHRAHQWDADGQVLEYFSNLQAQAAEATGLQTKLLEQTRSGWVGKSWSCQSVPCVFCPVRGLTWDYPKPSNTQTSCFFSPRNQMIFFRNWGYCILKPKPYLWQRCWWPLFSTSQRTTILVAEAARYLEGAQDLPVVSHDPCQIMAGRRSDFIRRFRWTVVVGNWRPPKSTGEQQIVIIFLIVWWCLAILQCNYI